MSNREFKFYDFYDYNDYNSFYNYKALSSGPQCVDDDCYNDKNKSNNKTSNNKSNSNKSNSNKSSNNPTLLCFNGNQSLCPELKGSSLVTDKFFKQLYKYHQSYGYYSFLLKSIGKIFYTTLEISLFIFLSLCIDWNQFHICGKTRTIDECKNIFGFLISVPNNGILTNIILCTYNIILFMLFLFAVYKFIGNIKLAREMYKLCSQTLDISNDEVKQISWEDLVKRVCKVYNEKDTSINSHKDILTNNHKDILTNNHKDILTNNHKNMTPRNKNKIMNSEKQITNMYDISHLKTSNTKNLNTSNIKHLNASNIKHLTASNIKQHIMKHDMIVYNLIKHNIINLGHKSYMYTRLFVSFLSYFLIKPLFADECVDTDRDKCINDIDKNKRDIRQNIDRDVKNQYLTSKKSITQFKTRIIFFGILSIILWIFIVIHYLSKSFFQLVSQIVDKNGNNNNDGDIDFNVDDDNINSDVNDANDKGDYRWPFYARFHLFRYNELPHMRRRRINCYISSIYMAFKCFPNHLMVELTYICSLLTTSLIGLMIFFTLNDTSMLFNILVLDRSLFFWIIMLRPIAYFCLQYNTSFKRGFSIHSLVEDEKDELIRILNSVDNSRGNRDDKNSLNDRNNSITNSKNGNKNNTMIARDKNHQIHEFCRFTRQLFKHKIIIMVEEIIGNSIIPYTLLRLFFRDAEHMLKYLSDNTFMLDCVGIVFKGNDVEMIKSDNSINYMGVKSDTNNQSIGLNSITNNESKSPIDINLVKSNLEPQKITNDYTSPVVHADDHTSLDMHGINHTSLDVHGDNYTCSVVGDNYYIQLSGNDKDDRDDKDNSDDESNYSTPKSSICFNEQNQNSNNQSSNNQDSNNQDSNKQDSNKQSSNNQDSNTNNKNNDDYNDNSPPFANDDIPIDFT